MQITKKELRNLIKEEILEYLSNTSKEKKLYQNHNLKDGAITISQSRISYGGGQTGPSESITMYMFSEMSGGDIDFNFTLEEFKKFKRNINKIKITPIE